MKAKAEKFTKIENSKYEENDNSDVEITLVSDVFYLVKYTQMIQMLV